jgi:hypothetical protein
MGYFFRGKDDLIFAGKLFLDFGQDQIQMISMGNEIQIIGRDCQHRADVEITDLFLVNTIKV